MQPQTLPGDPGEIFPLASYPWQITLPARYGDLSPGGTIEHIGMARNYEDARGAFMRHLVAQAGLPEEATDSFIVRALNERLAPVQYPGEVTIGAAVIALGGSSFTMELAVFQGGVLFAGRSRALAVAVGPDHAPRALPDPLRAAYQAGFSERPAWKAPARPGPERRLPGHYPHQLSFPTRFSDTDLIGHINNVTLLRYCDEGRVAVLLAGEESCDLTSTGTVSHLDISYLQEARMGAPLTVATRIRGVEGDVVLLEQALFQGEACPVVCDSRVRVPEGTAQRAARQIA